MKVKVIQKPTYQYGGARYNPLGYSFQDVLGMGVGTLQTGLGIYDALHNNKPATTNPAAATTASTPNTTTPVSASAPVFNNWQGLSGNRQTTSPLHNTNILTTHQDGGENTVTPELLQAYQSIAQYLEQGEDPNTIINHLVDTGMSQDDAQNVVAQVMEYLNPTSEALMPQAQMGGTQPGGNGIFAGQSTEPYVIKKPLMKDGGHTYLTSQPAYTQKSYNYFGTSNAPARDSYTDNNEVTTSVKAVPREDATIEAEKGEYIFSDKGLYKIEGKKHYQGGTPLAAKGGEFIFSAHRDMSLDPKLQKEAGLKVHPSKALAEHTPAKVLERNVNVKEYNRLKTILENPKSDAITKKTAQFMLDKMHNKIDVIAKLQEGKKQPNPVEVQDQYLEQGQVQNVVNEQKQYAHGGLTTYQGGTDTSGVQVSDVNFSGTNNLQDLNRIVKVIDKAGNQETLDLMNPEDLKRYSQMYMYLGDGKYEGTDETTGATVYTYPLSDTIQEGRIKTYNLPAAEIKGEIDPRWADFIANNQDYLAMMTPAEKEEMKKMVLEGDVNNKSTGYWDRAGKFTHSHDPRMQIAAEKLIPFYGRESEGFGDWASEVFSTPQKVANKLLTGYYENPSQTANRLHIEDKDWEKKGIGTDIITDPLMIIGAADMLTGLAKIGWPQTFGKLATAAEKKSAAEAADLLEKDLLTANKTTSTAKREVIKINKSIKQLEKQITKETDKKALDVLKAKKASLEVWRDTYKANAELAKSASNAARKTYTAADKPNYSRYLWMNPTRRAATTYLYEPAGRGLGTAAAHIPYIWKPEVIARITNAIGRGVYNIATDPRTSQFAVPAIASVGSYLRHTNDDKNELLRNYSETRKRIINQGNSGLSAPTANTTNSSAVDSTQLAPPTPTQQVNTQTNTQATTTQQTDQYHPTRQTYDRVYHHTVSHYEPSTGKYENTDLDQHNKPLKEYTTDYKVGTTDSPYYKKQLGGYFAMGGLNQYEPGGPTQPTYYTSPKSGIRTGANAQGVPGLYRGDKNIFDVYYNPEDITATGKSASFKGGLNDLNNIVKSMEEAGVDFSNINTGKEFQTAMYNWRLNNDPDALDYLWSTTGATNNVMKYPEVRTKLNQFGVKTQDSDKNYTIDFTGMSPEKRHEALTYLGNYFPDNYVGLRSIGAYTKPTTPVRGKIPPIELPKPEVPRPKPLDFEVPEKTPNPSSPTETIVPPPVKPPYGEVGAWQNAQYWNALRKARFTYTPPIEQPNTIFTPMSRQPFEDEAGRARYSSNQLASKFGDVAGKQIAAAQQNQQINKALFDVEKYNTEGFNQNYNENLLRNANKVNQFNQMAKTVHDQNNLAQDKTDEANAFAFNQYAAARQKDLLAKYYAEKDLQTSMLPYASTYDTVDANGKPIRRLAFPINPNGSFNPNWNGWNTSAVNSYSKNDMGALIKEIDDSGLPADKKLELKIKALRGDK